MIRFSLGRPRLLSVWKWQQVVLLISSLAAVLGPGHATGEPYAEWVEDEGLSEAKREILLSFRKSRIPDRAEVPFPRYPDARVLLGDNTAIAPPVPTEWGSQIGVLLVSKDSLLDIARWYEERLSGYSRFDYAVDGRAKVLFIAGCKDFDYQRDSVVLTTKPHVIVAAMGPGVGSVLQGYATVIELAYEPRK